MIIQCQGCAAKYFLPEDKVPSKPTKVRCPKCKAVFTLIPREQAVAAKISCGADGAAEAAMPRLEKPGPAHSTPRAEGAKGPEAKPEPGAKRLGRGKDDRAKRLARVLVSDILCYNKDKRDQAILDGNLMVVLGEEIRKSWDLYKEKVGADVAGSTNYFKEALNEILADGREVF